MRRFLGRRGWGRRAGRSRRAGSGRVAVRGPGRGGRWPGRLRGRRWAGRSPGLRGCRWSGRYTGRCWGRSKAGARWGRSGHRGPSRRCPCRCGRLRSLLPSRSARLPARCRARPVGWAGAGARRAVRRRRRTRRTYPIRELDQSRGHLPPGLESLQAGAFPLGGWAAGLRRGRPGLASVSGVSRRRFRRRRRPRCRRWPSLGSVPPALRGPRLAGRSPSPGRSRRPGPPDRQDSDTLDS